MFYPMLAMVFLIFTVGFFTAYVRISGVAKGKVKARYFKLMSGEEVPEIITKTTRQFNNMFEMPMLFFIACMLYIVLGLQNTIAIVLAWVFVITRCVQAYIHITYNNPLHRMLAFNTGSLSVLILWIILALNARHLV